jgi:hypothetical protein
MNGYDENNDGGEGYSRNVSVVGGCGCGWISLGKSGSCDCGREFSWNKTARLRPDPVGSVDSTGGDTLR